MNIAYKHLDARLRIADLTLSQWAAVLVGLGLGATWFELSPLGTYVTIFMSVYVAALPIGAALFASYTEFDLVLLVRTAIAWRRREGRVIAGAGRSAHGYVVAEEALDERAPARTAVADLDLSRLWAS